MRIAQVSTLHHKVPPQGEGSIENLVSILTEGLVSRGHEVTLFARPDSITRAELRSPAAGYPEQEVSLWDWRTLESYQTREAFRSWKDFDVIHCHSYHFGLLFCDFVPIPSLHSIHIEPGPDYRFLADRTVNRSLHFCSNYQARDFGAVKGVHVVPHGIEMERFSAYASSGGDYLVYLGRFIPNKGPLEAIAIAEKAGMPLKLAGPENDYFHEAIEPCLNRDSVEYVGEVHGKQKSELLQGAKALLYPVQWGEPFGLVLLEAMACGTPVLAYNRGAVSEIVDHGRTGWIGEEPEDLQEGIRNLGSFDRDSIRKYVRENFSAHVMVDRIERLLFQVVEGAKS
jgi:glycosyltransferase involved in cell wall biosynthesis